MLETAVLYRLDKIYGYPQKRGVCFGMILFLGCLLSGCMQQNFIPFLNKSAEIAFARAATGIALTPVRKLSGATSALLGSLTGSLLNHGIDRSLSQQAFLSESINAAICSKDRFGTEASVSFEFRSSIL